MAFVLPSTVEYCMYQVPIITMAYLPDMKPLLASGYCCTPSAPSCMIPSSNSFFQMLSARTMAGSVQETSPLSAFSHTPGLTLSVIACSVSSLNAGW